MAPSHFPIEHNAKRDRCVKIFSLKQKDTATSVQPFSFCTELNATPWIKETASV